MYPTVQHPFLGFWQVVYALEKCPGPGLSCKLGPGQGYGMQAMLCMKLVLITEALSNPLILATTCCYRNTGFCLWVRQRHGRDMTNWRHVQVSPVLCDACHPAHLLLMQVPAQSLDDQAVEHASPPAPLPEDPAQAAAVPLVSTKVAALLRHLQGYKVSCHAGSADAKDLGRWRETKHWAAARSERHCGVSAGHQGAAVPL